MQKGACCFDPCAGGNPGAERRRRGRRPDERAERRLPASSRSHPDVRERFDRYQRRHRWCAFPLAVRQKYAADQGGYLAAAITYYAFFSLFPLLLVFTTVVGYVLRSHPHLQARVVGSAVGRFPIVGGELAAGRIHGHGLALAFGVAAMLWSGTAVFLASENAMNTLWGVPPARRPDFLRARGRALVLLVVLGGGVVVATGLGGLAATGVGLGVGWKLGSAVASTALDFVLFWVGFRLLTAREVGWMALRGGAVAAAVCYEALQLLGGFYVGHVLKGASGTYGVFGVVIGLLSWIYLVVHVTLLAAEGNVVAVRRLWPRSILPPAG